MKLLVALGYISCFRLIVNLFNNLIEVCGTVKLTRLERRFVVFNDLWDAIDSRVEDVTVEGEAMRASVSKRLNRSSESIEIDHLV